MKDSIFEIYLQKGYSTTLRHSLDKFEACTVSLDGLSIRLIEKNRKKLISTKLINMRYLDRFIDYLRSRDGEIHLVDKEENNYRQDVIISDLDKMVYDNVLRICSNYSSVLEIIVEKKELYKKINILDKEVEKKSDTTFLCIREKGSWDSIFYFNIINTDNIEIIKNEIENTISYIGLRKSAVLKPGKYNLILKDSLGGVLFHEVCGHQFELSKANSPCSPTNFQNGYNLGSKHLTIKDTPFQLITPEDFDDEGSMKHDTMLLDNGKIISPLTDIKSIMEFPSYELSGNSRRESYKHYPEPRMYCTLVENGVDDISYIINSIHYGFYVDSIREAYLNHQTGIVSCYVNRAFIIENGKLTNKIVKFIIEDSAFNLFSNISAVANDFTIKSGYCNSSSGRLYVEHGSPSIYLANIRVKEVYLYEK